MALKLIVTPRLSRSAELLVAQLLAEHPTLTLEAIFKEAEAHGFDLSQELGSKRSLPALIEGCQPRARRFRGSPRYHR